jgi:cell wall-associated NlpC family hydrolase
VLKAQERASALIGTPFRLQGRIPEIGLDCLGVVVIAYELRPREVPRYRITDGTWSEVSGGLSRWFEPIENRMPANGDLLVFRFRTSFHFGVVSDGYFIHADVRAGKVVRRRLPTHYGPQCRIFRYRGET